MDVSIFDFSQRIDVAIRLGSLLDTYLVATKVCEVLYHVCASPEYLRRLSVVILMVGLVKPMVLYSHTRICDVCSKMKCCECVTFCKSSRDYSSIMTFKRWS